MAEISDAEVRRLLSYLQHYVGDEDLAEIESELRGDEAEELLRDDDLLEFFPELFDEFVVADKNWKLRVIPHAHLRMVQRGVKLNDVSAFFCSFVELFTAEKQSIFVGHYALYGRIKRRNFFVTVRIDLDMVTDVEGIGHVVTVHIGRGNNEGMMEVDLPI
jgi:hypothetical protein